LSVIDHSFIALHIITSLQQNLTLYLLNAAPTSARTLDHAQHGSLDTEARRVQSLPTTPSNHGSSINASKVLVDFPWSPCPAWTAHVKRGPGVYDCLPILNVNASHNASDLTKMYDIVVAPAARPAPHVVAWGQCGDKGGSCKGKQCRDAPFNGARCEPSSTCSRLSDLIYMCVPRHGASETVSR
jgi:hypothetical protein